MTPDLVLSRRRLLQSLTVSAAMLVIPGLRAEPPPVPVITGCSHGAGIFLQGVRRHIPVIHVTTGIMRIHRLPPRLRQYAGGTLLGLLDQAGYILLESMLHDRGGRILFSQHHSEQSSTDHEELYHLGRRFAYAAAGEPVPAGPAVRSGPLIGFLAQL